MTNKEKFMQLVSWEETSTLKDVKQRIKHRAMLRESQEIALKVLERLEEIGWTQKDLAEKMGVTPQYVNKIVRGKENFTLEMQIKLQTILDIPILATYYEDKLQNLDESIQIGEHIEKHIVTNQPTKEPEYSNATIIIPISTISKVFYSRKVS
ncbi:MAG: helix-turn-helix transcriptional regulator [Ignavibacteria bacterium]|nr:helix-turn-helix transcriptional regulator [Ignavibacteria bacterium]